MKLSDAFPSRWLKSSDLGGEPRVVTIEKSAMEPVGPGGAIKLVIKFRGLDPLLVCNKTNATAIGEFLGDDTDKWTGKQIVLAPDRTSFNGSQVDCIRVRQPKGPVAALKPPAHVWDKSGDPKNLPVGDDVPF